MATRNGAIGIISAFAVGGLVGAGLALLFAPQSGDATRRKIIEAVEDAKEEITDYAERIKAKLG